MKPEILYEGHDFMVVNKPSGLLSIPDREGKEDSLKLLLQKTHGLLYTVHRLDKETSGAIVFARNERMHTYLSTAFTERRIEKEYHGLVAGIPAVKHKTITASIMEHPVKKGIMVVHAKGKASVTDYEVQEELGRYAWLCFRIHTGRTHQIRVHMQNEGHPIVCDPLYGDGQPIFLSSIKRHFKLSQKEETEQPLLHRLGLHASRIRFVLPEGTYFTIEAPFPKDLTATLRQLRAAMERRKKQ